MTDLRQLLAAEQLDAVTIATPDHLHVEPALAAIAAGCHVFCEKPLADERGRGARALSRRPPSAACSWASTTTAASPSAIARPDELLDDGSDRQVGVLPVRVSDARRRPPWPVIRT